MKNKIAAVVLSALLALGAVACSAEGTVEDDEGGAVAPTEATS